jgi:hypothetical protein
VTWLARGAGDGRDLGTEDGRRSVDLAEMGEGDLYERPVSQRALERAIHALPASEVEGDGRRAAAGERRRGGDTHYEIHGLKRSAAKTWWARGRVGRAKQILGGKEAGGGVERVVMEGTDDLRRGRDISPSGLAGGTEGAPKTGIWARWR